MVSVVRTFGAEPDAVDITVWTRRAIADDLALANLPWSGRLPEDAFLGRLYDLTTLPSTDARFSDARGDIWRHRVLKVDWPPDWVFTDVRFGLLWCPNQQFVRFLCETLHPAVRDDPGEVTRVRDTYNRRLRADGWEVYERAVVAGRPVFAARWRPFPAPAQSGRRPR